MKLPATAQGGKEKQVSRASDRAVTKRMNFLRKLLKDFGLTLRAYDPGIAASLEGKPFDFGKAEWDWIEPLLIELRASREKGDGK